MLPPSTRTMASQSRKPDGKDLRLKSPERNVSCQMHYYGDGEVRRLNVPYVTGLIASQRYSLKKLRVLSSLPRPGQSPKVTNPRQEGHGPPESWKGAVLASSRHDSPHGFFPPPGRADPMDIYERDTVLRVLSRCRDRLHPHSYAPRPGPFLS